MEREIQTLKNLIIASLEDKIGFTESLNQTLRVLRFMKHTGFKGFKVNPIELYHGRKFRT